MYDFARLFTRKKRVLLADSGWGILHLAEMNISLCIITLNEEANLARCLKSCADVADEMIVLDSGSTDGTEAVARNLGARFICGDWPGYVAQKNKALSLASNNWVISLDGDEELSEPLRAEILAVKSSPPGDAVSGYSIPRCVFFEGRWIRHGDWYPDRLVRFFRRDRGRFTGGRVHERLEISGSIHRLRGDINHYSYEDAEDHRVRTQTYGRLWAQDKFEHGKNPGPLTPAVHAGWRWFRGYFLRGGFWDGSLGLKIANMTARDTHWKYQCLRSLWRGNRQS